VSVPVCRWNEEKEGKDEEKEDACLVQETESRLKDGLSIRICGRGFQQSVHLCGDDGLDLTSRMRERVKTQGKIDVTSLSISKKVGSG
jgi:hypothetical protein